MSLYVHRYMNEWMSKGSFHCVEENTEWKWGKIEKFPKRLFRLCVSIFWCLNHSPNPPPRAGIPLTHWVHAIAIQSLKAPKFMILYLQWRNYESWYIFGFDLILFVSIIHQWNPSIIARAGANQGLLPLPRSHPNCLIEWMKPTWLPHQPHNMSNMVISSWT